MGYEAVADQLERLPDERAGRVAAIVAALRRAAEEARDEQAREDAETALTFQTIGHLVPNGKGGVEWESYGEWIAEKIRSSRPSAFVSDCERKQFMQDHDSEMSGERR